MDLADMDLAEGKGMNLQVKITLRLALVALLGAVGLMSSPALGAGTCEGVFRTVKPTVTMTPEATRIRFLARSVRRAGSTEALAIARYGKEFGLEHLAKLRELGPQYEVLIADPGIVFRMEDFLRFAQVNRGLRPWDLREAYSRHLGSVHVVRALALTPELAADVAKFGLTARILRPDGAELRAKNPSPYTHNFFSMMKERFRNANGDVVARAPDLAPIDGLLSVTFDEKIAKVVAGQIVKQVNVPYVKMYIYDIEMPAIDLFARPGDNGVMESFVLFRIFPQEIVATRGPLEPEMIQF